MVEFSSEPIGAWALPFGHALASHHKQPLRGLGVPSVRKMGDTTYCILGGHQESPPSKQKHRA